MPKISPVVTTPPATAATSGSLLRDRGNICMGCGLRQATLVRKIQAGGDEIEQSPAGRGAEDTPQTVALIEDGPSGVQAFDRRFRAAFYRGMSEILARCRMLLETRGS